MDKNWKRIETNITLKIYVDKEYANFNLIKMMHDFVEVLKDAISGTNSQKEAKEDAERALERAKREVERIKGSVSN